MFEINNDDDRDGYPPLNGDHLGDGDCPRDGDHQRICLVTMYAFT